MVDGPIKPDVCGIGRIQSAKSYSDQLCQGNCDNHGGTAYMQGTSMAAPSVTAAVAVIYQYLRDGHYHCRLFRE